MLPLQALAAIQGWHEPTLLKVAGMAEFSAGSFALERLLLDLREPGFPLSSPALIDLPWAGFLVSDLAQIPPGRNGVALKDDPIIVRHGDVIELQPAISKVSVRFRRGDNGNVLFATERCNSYCLMCSQPPREVDDVWRIEQLCALVELIDRDEPSIAISGGEPTLLGEGLVQVVSACAEQLPATQLHILSNGRAFGEGTFAQRFTDRHPSLSWGIPLYGDYFGLHDYIVQREGAFAETVRGLYALHAAKQSIEVRVVLVKPTVLRLEALVRYLYRNFPFIEHVALMGIEPIGFARANHSSLWIDPTDAVDALQASVDFLDRRGMAVSLYNLPLCVLPRALWPFARRSVSNWKQDYLPVCAPCAVREQCAGFFAWVSPAWMSRSIAPITEGWQPCTSH